MKIISNLVNSVIFKAGSAVAAFALFVTTVNVNSVCIFFLHQAEIPQSAKKLRKF